MPVLGLILRALLAKYGAELVYRLLQELTPQGTGPADVHLANRIEQLAGSGLITPMDPRQLDITEFDEDEDGYVWDYGCTQRIYREECL